jgi:hypothetical protein
VRGHMKFVPNKLFDGYEGNFEGNRWDEGDFLLHFAGMNTTEKAGRWMKAYAARQEMLAL